MDASKIRKAFEQGAKLKNPINLSIGQPDFDVPKEIREEAINAIQNKKNSYTPTTGILELREKVAQKLNKKHNIHASPENIMITSAASGALSIILPVLIDKDDEIIIFDPYFVMYKQLVLLYGGIPIFVNKNDDFTINFENLKKAITPKTKAILFNTPENPTGYVSDRKEIEEIAKIAKKHDLYVVSDEIYEDFVYDKKHFSIASIYEKTILVSGFSKSHAMTGWRVGYFYAPSEIIEQAAKIQQFTFVCAPTPFQYASIKAIDYDISNYIKEYKERRDLIYNGIKDKYDTVKPQGAFYMFIKYPYEPQKFIDDCLAQNLLVVPGDAFSEKNTHFRISFATTKEKLTKAIEILNKLI